MKRRQGGNRILMVCQSENAGQYLVGILRDAYEVLTADNCTEAMRYLTRYGEGISVMLLDIEHEELEGMRLLETCCSTFLTEAIPVVIVTEDADRCDLETAYRLGATDYLTWHRKPAAILQRIRRIAERSGRTRVDELLDAKSRNFYLFHHCIGAAMLVAFDGERLRALMINDSFYELVGQRREEFDLYCGDLLQTVLQEDKKGEESALEEALRSGIASARMHKRATREVFQVTYRHVAETSSGDVLFIQVENITDSVQNMLAIQAVAQMPGTVVFDYNTRDDLLLIHASGEEGLKTTRIERFMQQGAEMAQNWISPESYRAFWSVCEDALRSPSSGQLDFKGRFFSKKFHWHRMYFRSLSDPGGMVFRIVGRIEDVEKSIWMGLPYEKVHIYDPATQMLTFHAIQEYISQKIGQNRSGTLMLLDLEGLEEAGLRLGEMRYHLLLHSVADIMCGMFRRDDIMGRYGDDGFVIFMAEAFREPLARRTCQQILNELYRVLWEENGLTVQCSIGVAVAESGEISVGELLNRASVALGEARKDPVSKFLVYQDAMSQAG